MLDPVVRSAFVILLAWLLKLGAAALGLEIDDATLNTLAGVIVVYILSRLGVPLVRRAFPGLARRGLVSERDEE
jgi:hypothetical protein